MEKRNLGDMLVVVGIIFLPASLSSLPKKEEVTRAPPPCIAVKKLRKHIIVWYRNTNCHFTTTLISSFYTATTVYTTFQHFPTFITYGIENTKWCTTLSVFLQYLGEVKIFVDYKINIDKRKIDVTIYLVYLLILVIHEETINFKSRFSIFSYSGSLILYLEHVCTLLNVRQILAAVSKIN